MVPGSMALRFLGLLSVLVASSTGRAAAVPQPIRARDATAFLDPAAVIALSSAEVSAFAPYEQFARAAYCSSSSVATWTCGEACSAISGFEPTITGGDGNSIQQYFVGYWSAQNAVVVAHEGTDPTQLLSDLTDVDIFMNNLDSTLFPGVSSSVWVHSGFANEHAQTASAVLSAAESIISLHGATTVICIGHSLGGALAELDAVFLRLNLPSNVVIMGRTFGTPRVGNPEWASLVDSLVPDFTRMNNALDPVPIVPGRFLGFQHPRTELHVVSDSSEQVVACPGNDDADDKECTISSVPNIFEADVLDHLGPYPGGIYMGTIFCT